MGSNSVHDLIRNIYRLHSDTVYCSRKGGRQRGNSWSKSFFLENKVVINFVFRHEAKKSGHLDHNLSLNLAVKEQNERVYKCGRECNFFCRECKFVLP